MTCCSLAMRTAGRVVEKSYSNKRTEKLHKVDIKKKNLTYWTTEKKRLNSFNAQKKKKKKKKPRKLQIRWKQAKEEKKTMLKTKGRKVKDSQIRQRRPLPPHKKNEKEWNQQNRNKRSDKGYARSAFSAAESLSRWGMVADPAAWRWTHGSCPMITSPASSHGGGASLVNKR